MTRSGTLVNTKTSFNKESVGLRCEENTFVTAISNWGVTLSIFWSFFNDTHNNLPLMYGELPVESDGSSISIQFEHFLLRPESITPPEIC